MDKLDHYRDIIEQIIRNAVVSGAERTETPIRSKTVFDRQTDSYLIINEGWEKSRHTHTILTHLEIIDRKIWVQRDGSEYGLARDLEAAGVPKSDIVLGFQPPYVRPYTDYAAA